MTDAGLLKELDAAVNRIGSVRRLSGPAADACVDLLRDSFVETSGHRWWWDALRVPGSTHDYGSGDGLSYLLGLVQLEPTVLLFVTDDSHPPWAVYEGPPKMIVDILRECRFFEYAMAAPDATWVIFDTHHNQLVIAGRLMQPSTP